MAIKIDETNPKPEEYIKLRFKAGLSPKSQEAATIALPNTLYSVCLRDKENLEEYLIGMGRVIGDGACFFQIVDIAVDPYYQGKGLGKLIMEKIESYLKSVAKEGSYVSLIGDKPEFYQKLGYQFTAPEGHGMYKVF